MEDEFNTISKMSFAGLIRDNAIKIPEMIDEFLDILDRNDILKPIEYIDCEMANGKVIKEPYYYDSQILVVLEVTRIRNGFRDIGELKNFQSINYYNKWAITVKKMEKFFERALIYKNKEYDKIYADILSKKIESYKNDKKISKEDIELEAKYYANEDFREWWEKDGGFKSVKETFVDFVVKELGISLLELKNFRENIISFSSFYRFYGQASKIKSIYIMQIPYHIIAESEYVHKLLDLLNEYISFFDSEKYVTVKDVILNATNLLWGYENNPNFICPYCHKYFIKKRSNQKTCLRKECIENHKKELDKKRHQKIKK